MITRRVVAAVWFLALLVGADRGEAADAVPLGHPDFYPSDERPIGWRGDGTACFKGADVPATYDVEKQTNVVWRSAMPGAGYCQPIVVGEKVFVTADPNLLVCVDVHTGKILWQRAVDHTQTMPGAMRKAAQAEIAFWQAKWRQYSAWRRDLDALEKRLQAKGIRPRKLYTRPWQQRQSKILSPARTPPKRMEDDGERAKVYRRILADPELGPELKRLEEIQNANGFAILTGCNGEIMLFYDRRNAGPLRERYRKNAKEYDFYCASNWEGYTTYSFATPCSDGEYVYVTTVNNAIACYDLNGNQRWLVWDRDGRTNGRLHTRFVASPVLYKDKLIVHQNSLMRVYDKDTGQELWQIKNPYFPGRDKIGSLGRPRPEATSPVVGSLPLPDGGELDIICDGGSRDNRHPNTGHVYRLDDGHILYDKMPYLAKGATPILYDDIFVWISGGDNTPAGCGAVRLKATSRNAVTREELWSYNSHFPCAASRITDGEYIYYFKEKRKGHTAALHLKTGQRKVISEDELHMFHCSPIMVGGQILSQNWNKVWDEHRKTKEITRKGWIGLHVLDLSTGRITGNDRAMRDLRVLEDEEFFLRNRYVGCGNRTGLSSPYAQANRVFVRSIGYLWCLGNPRQPFPAPRDCPAAARVR